MKYLILSLICILSLIGCWQNYSIHRITDVSKKSEIILQSPNKEKNIASIEINISGKIEGEADIQLLLNEKIYKTEKLVGNFKVSFGGDWYSNVAKLIYIPQNAVSGEVKLEYKFINI